MRNNQTITMNTFYVKLQTAKDIISKAFPSYSGKRDITATICQPGYKHTITTSWSGGSRYSYVLLDREFNTLPLPSDIGSGFGSNPNPVEVEVKPGFLLFQHCIYRGKDLGVSVFICEGDIPKALQPVESESLSTEEMLVLKAARSFKSSYGGKTRLDFMNEAKSYTSKIPDMSKEKYEDIRSVLVNKGYLTKRKSISTEGKNLLAQNDIDFIELWEKLA